MRHFCQSPTPIALPADQPNDALHGPSEKAQTASNRVDDSKLITVMSKPHGSSPRSIPPMDCRHPRPSVVQGPSFRRRPIRSLRVVRVCEWVSVTKWLCSIPAAPVCHRSGLTSHRGNQSRFALRNLVRGVIGCPALNHRSNLCQELLSSFPDHILSTRNSRSSGVFDPVCPHSSIFCRPFQQTLR